MPLRSKRIPVFSYASRNRGVMHACGHDAHTAMLVGAARVLSRLRSELRGTVKFFFQPAEELDRGALTLLKAGVCDDLDAAFAIHVSPDLPAGRVSVEPGAIMASSDAFDVRLKGRGGHGAVPHQGIDAVVAAAALVMNLQSLASREYDAEDPLVVTVGSLHAGTGFNILAETAELSGTVRTFNPDVASSIPTSFERVVKNTAATFRVTAKIDYTPGCRVLENDPGLTRTVRKAVEQIFEADGLARLPRSMAGEDFAWFKTKMSAGTGLAGGRAYAAAELSVAQFPLRPQRGGLVARGGTVCPGGLGDDGGGATPRPLDPLQRL